MPRRTNHDPYIDLLGSLEMFRHCTRDELKEIASLATLLDLPARQVLCRQGEIGVAFFVIVEGEAAVDVDGSPVAQLGRGSFFGEQALLEHSPRNATVVAVTPLQALVLNPAEFEVMLKQAPHANADMRGEISDRARTAPQTD